MKHRLTSALFILFGLVGLAHPARAQFLGYTTPQTVDQVLANTLACTGAPQTFNLQNLGQNVHFVTYLFTGGTQFTVFLQAHDAASFYTVSDVAVSPTGILTANGYYTQLQAVISCPIGANVTLVYHGSSGNALASTGLQDVTVYDKLFANGSNATLTQTFNVAAPYGNTCGQVMFQYAVGQAGSTLQVVAIGGNVPGINVIQSAAIANTVSAQFFNVPCAPGQKIQVTYTSAGGGTTFNMEYLFMKPGMQGTPDPCNTGAIQSAAINAGAAATSSIIAPAANASIYVCGYSLSQGAAGTFQWEFGTGATCGTGTTVLTGAFPTLSSTPFNYGGGTKSVFSTPEAQRLCIVTTGGGATAQGVVTFVQE
jgi:hypothetical protein